MKNVVVATISKKKRKKLRMTALPPDYNPIDERIFNGIRDALVNDQFHVFVLHPSDGSWALDRIDQLHPETVRVIQRYMNENETRGSHRWIILQLRGGRVAYGAYAETKRVVHHPTHWYKDHHGRTSCGTHYNDMWPDAHVLQLMMNRGLLSVDGKVNVDEVQRALENIGKAASNRTNWIIGKAMLGSRGGESSAPDGTFVGELHPPQPTWTEVVFPGTERLTTWPVSGTGHQMDPEEKERLMNKDKN